MSKDEFVAYWMAIHCNQNSDLKEGVKTARKIATHLENCGHAPWKSAKDNLVHMLKRVKGKVKEIG